jgi:HNH endonuclease
MSCESELEAIARELRKATPYFKGGWHLNAVQAFIRDGGCCVYCGKPLLDNYGVSKTATIDHLLPSHTYPERGWNVDNLVPACATCNRTKLYYDPSETNGKDLVITAEVRLGLIQKAKAEIDRITKARMTQDDEYWEREFQTARLCFQEAVAKYLKCKEFTAAV